MPARPGCDRQHPDGPEGQARLARGLVFLYQYCYYNSSSSSRSRSRSRSRSGSRSRIRIVIVINSCSSIFACLLGGLMYGLYRHFNNLCFKKTHLDDLSAAHVFVW